MTRARRHGLASLLLAGALGAAAATADPLTDASRRDGWVSYSVALAGREAPCCYESWRRGQAVKRTCRLDGREHDGMYGTMSGTIGGRRATPPVTQLHVFLRFEDGAVRRLLAVGSDCPVEAGDAAVRALDDVTPAASAALLLELAQATRGDLADEALQALVLHDQVGTETLLALVRDPQRPPAMRRQALFWLGQSEDPRALAEIESILNR